MQRFTTYILLALLVALTGCHREDDPAPEMQKARRTLLVYMVADNSLGASSYDSSDLREMEEAVRAYGLNDCRVLVYHHPKNSAPQLKELTMSGFVPLTDYPYDADSYSVDEVRMKSVFDDMRLLAPAYDYGLVLWSHGNGWIETSTSRREPMRAFGEDRGYNMKISSLAKALEGQGFSFVYFDCCHMATVEVAYELRHTTPYIVASAIELPAAGMDYTVNLPVFLADTPDMIAAATNTFEHYNSQAGSNRTCTMSVINTAALDNLASATRSIMGSAPAPARRADVQRFMTSNCTLFDMGHYIDLLDIPQDMKDAWWAALDEVVIYRDATPYIWERVRINHHCGLGCWVPETVDDITYRGYNNLAWYRDVVSAHPLFK